MLELPSPRELKPSKSRLGYSGYSGYTTGPNSRGPRKLTLREKEELEFKRDLANYGTRHERRREMAKKKPEEAESEAEEEPEGDASFKFL